jgi:predicted Zn finger-like uncharacterized protein
MDVRCTRCGTEYEFDDALISERGTSVRCTQCGYQFKVFPPQLAAMGPDEWVVLTSLGRRVVYRTLRELQNGIAKNEVAREDLLARGSKAPRPLGSIAELDPLFLTKAAPERQPSTLTGVAPPPVQGSTKPIAPPGGSLGRHGHDTFSGVAPPANLPPEPPSPAEGSPRSPLRVGGSRTVLGIGDAVDSSAGESPAAGQSSSAATPIYVPAREGPSVSAPPETRSFEQAWPEGDRQELGARQAPAAPVTVGSEPPTNRPPPSEQANALAALTALSDNTAPLAVTSEVGLPEPTAPMQVRAEPLPPESDRTRLSAAQTGESRVASRHPEAKPGVVIGKVQLATKPTPPVVEVTAVRSASDPPTGRWRVQSHEQQRQASERLDADPGSTKLSELPIGVSSMAPRNTSSSETARSGQRKPAKTEPAKTEPAKTEPAKTEPAKTEPAKTEPAKTEPESQRPESRDDRATTPPTRPRTKAARTTGSVRAQSSLTPGSTKGIASTPAAGASQPVGATAKSSSSFGRIAVAIGLLALGLFAGMKIVGTQLQKQKQSLSPPEPAASSPPVQAAWDAPIDELLKLGDVQGAEQLLSSVPASEQDTPLYRVSRVRVRALSADMAWWKVQLVGKRAGATYTQAKQQLSERLERLKLDIAAVGPDAAWPEQVQAGWLDARRMQGEKSEPTEPALVERLKHPTTQELRYTQLVLAWVRVGLPDPATVEGLRQVRSARLDLGPRAVALVVALVQLNRFDDAKAELKTLAAQSRPHSLYDEMAAYVRSAEQAHAETPSDTHRDAGMLSDNSEPGDLGTEFTEGDFRLRLTRANECLARNELTKAQKYLRSVLAQRPNDTEAITAMGDVQRRRGALTEARNLYDKALAINANYLPAMSGSADLRYKSGDRAGAAGLYRRILERVGETPGYGQVAAVRLKELEAASKPAGDPASPTPEHAVKDLP